MTYKYPYYKVIDDKGEQYADCGHEKTAQDLIMLNRGRINLSYRRVDEPKPINPETVDVGVIPVEELPGQQGLPSRKRELDYMDAVVGIEPSNLDEYEGVFDG